MPLAGRASLSLPGQRQGQASVSVVRAEGMDGAPSRLAHGPETGGGIDDGGERADCRGEGTRAAGAACIDGRYCPVEDAKISVLDLGVTHSDCTYDVVHVWRGRARAADRAATGPVLAPP